MKADSTTVRVFNGDLETAIRTLNKKMHAAKILPELKWRALYPNKAARRKAKKAWGAHKRNKRRRGN